VVFTAGTIRRGHPLVVWAIAEGPAAAAAVDAYLIARQNDSCAVRRYAQLLLSIRRLINRARTLYRWPARPTTRRLR
jgi:hypothetical protein